MEAVIAYFNLHCQNLPEMNKISAHCVIWPLQTNTLAGETYLSKHLGLNNSPQHICIRKAPSLNLHRNTRYPRGSVVFASSDKQMPGIHTKKHRYTFLPQRDVYPRSLCLIWILRILNRTATHKGARFCKFILFGYFASFLL